MIKKIILFLIVFFPYNSYGLIKVDITRGNLNPLPIAVSPLAIDDNSKKEFQNFMDFRCGHLSGHIFGEKTR